MSSRRLQLVWSIKQEPEAVLRVAFATTDRLRVNQHFGAAEGFAIYEITPDKATLVGIGEFAEEAMDGNEDKLAAKGIQPIRIGELDGVDELLLEISQGMREGGVAWIDRAIANQQKAGATDRFATMEEEGWEG